MWLSRWVKAARQPADLCKTSLHVQLSPSLSAEWAEKHSAAGHVAGGPGA